MIDKISNFIFLILLLLLQSCSGGRIGNFLESSFNNNPNQITQNVINKKSQNETTSKDNKLLEEKDKITELKFQGESRSQIIDNSSSKTPSDANINKNQKKNYNPKSYRIFVILKKVDPSFPTENFSKVLKNGNINFEIEKIELINESNQNKR